MEISPRFGSFLGPNPSLPRRFTASSNELPNMIVELNWAVRHRPKEHRMMLPSSNSTLLILQYVGSVKQSVVVSIAESTFILSQLLSVAKRIKQFKDILDIIVR